MSLSIITSPKAKSSPVKPTKSTVSYVQKTIGNDTWLVMAQSAIELEDEFANLYYTTQNQSNIFIQPPFEPKALKNLVNTNNVLGQCVEAMEVNIDGTGYDFVPIEEKKQSLLKPPKKPITQLPPPPGPPKGVVPPGLAAFQKNKGVAEKPQPQEKPLTEVVPGTPVPVKPTPEEVQAQADHQKLVDGQAAEVSDAAQQQYDEDLAIYNEEKAKEEAANAEKEIAKAFFNEPCPGKTFIGIRRQLRRDMESIGYAFLEVLRNVAGDVVGVRNIDTFNTRMVKLDSPILVDRDVVRQGKPVTLKIWERQRRFAQRVALKELVYYREFGTAREVDRKTGKWEILDQGEQNNVVKPEDRGTELIMFGIHPDVTTSYFLPRWINQMPSVVGSRKAEEANLEFLDAGGMPPSIIFVQGGTLGKDAADQLRMYLSGQNKNKHRAVVVDAHSSGGNLDTTAGTVKVTVERFGAERAQDAMFMKYDDSTETHVVMGFRLPFMFLGKEKALNFATAQVSYMIAEQQVFGPERLDFDATINRTIMKELDMKVVKFESKPAVMVNADNQIKALTLAKGITTNKSLVDEINSLNGSHLEATEGTIAPAAPVGGKSPIPKNNPFQSSDSGGAPADSAGDGSYTGNDKTSSELVTLAQDYAAMRGLTKKREMSPDEKVRISTEVDGLSRGSQRLFNTLIAAYMYGQTSPDLVTLARHSHLH
jgi:capsid portal protein